MAATTPMATENENDIDNPSSVSSSAVPSMSSGYGYGSEMDELLQMAAKIKMAQPEQQQRRARWNNTPFYYQHALQYQSSIDLQMRRRDHDLKERLKYCHELKAKGSSAVQLQQWQEAAASYEHALSIFIYAIRFDTPDGTDIRMENTVNDIDDTVMKQTVRSIVHSLYQNLALVYLKQCRYDLVISVCGDALEYDEQPNGKTLYRLATAQYALNQLDTAIVTLTNAITEFTQTASTSISSSSTTTIPTTTTPSSNNSSGNDDAQLRHSRSLLQKWKVEQSKSKVNERKLFGGKLHAFASTTTSSSSTSLPSSSSSPASVSKPTQLGNKQKQSSSSSSSSLPWEAGRITEEERARAKQMFDIDLDDPAVIEELNRLHSVHQQTGELPPPNIPQNNRSQNKTDKKSWCGCCGRLLTRLKFGSSHNKSL